MMPASLPATREATLSPEKEKQQSPATVFGQVIEYIQGLAFTVLPVTKG